MDESKPSDNHQSPKDNTSQLKESNQCIALGVGVGGLGAAAAAISGAVCPLCVVVAPALIAVGVYKRFKS